MNSQALMSTLRNDLGDCNNDIPRYLYRVYAPDSNGHNSTTMIASAAMHIGKGHDKLLDIPRDEAKSMLKSHFRWEYFQRDEFVSWTSSLLYALQFAVRKTRNKKNPSIVSQEADIKLCVLDTIGLDTTSFFSASRLLRAYLVPSDDKIRQEYYTTEYILHGKIDVVGRSATVSLSELREEGLFDLIPELDDEDEKAHLFRRVYILRLTMASTDRPVTAIDGALSLWIALLFGRALAIPMMVALLTLRRRSPDDKRFLRLLREFAGKLISYGYGDVGTDGFTDPTKDFLVPYTDHAFSPTGVPELTNFTRMMNAGFDEMSRFRAGSVGGIDGLEAAVGGLDLGIGSVEDAADGANEEL